MTTRRTFLQTSAALAFRIGWMEGDGGLTAFTHRQRGGAWSWLVEL